MDRNGLLDNPILLFVTAGALVLLLIICIPWAITMRQWIRATMAGLPLTVCHIVGMRLRKSPPALLIDAGIMLQHQGIEVDMVELERVFLAYKDEIFTPRDLIRVMERNRNRG